MNRFFKTVAIVTLFSFCEKLLGFLYRIFLSHTIGAEGIGIFQVALSVFGLILTATCSGTPVTVSRLMTKYKAENKPEKIKSVITAGLSLAFFTTLPVCLFLLLFSGKFTFLFADERCVKIFLILTPTLVFSSVYAVLRGVFWGNKDFFPFSVIELLEEVCMIVFGVLLISGATDVTDGATKAGIAVAISYVFSFALATIVFIVRKNKLKNPLLELKPLLSSAVPITAMRTASSVAVSLVSIILPMRLIFYGLTESEAMSAFGAAMGQAYPLLFIPVNLIGSFTLVLVPEISENYYRKNHNSLKSDVEKALKFTTTLCALFVPVFLVCGEEIGIIVFGSTACGEYLSSSCLLMIFMGLSSISTSILNSMGLENRTLIYYILGGFLMLFSVWFLPKFFEINALTIGFLSVYGLTSILNLRLLDKRLVVKPKYLKSTLLTILSLLPTIVFGFILEELLLSVLGVFLTLLTCSIMMMVFNGLLLIGFGVLKMEFLRKIFKQKSLKYNQA